MILDSWGVEGGVVVRVWLYIFHELALGSVGNFDKFFFVL
jgi:hypothetical protein